MGELLDELEKKLYGRTRTEPLPAATALVHLHDDALVRLHGDEA